MRGTNEQLKDILGLKALW